MSETESNSKETATLAGGCFWCLEAVFEQLHGVERVVSGYANGYSPKPTYQQVCTGQTGYAEVVQVTFDPHVISYRELLKVFFAIHDPTTPNRQGADVGTQYRSGIYTQSDAQLETARSVVAEISQEGIWEAPLVTEVEPLQSFFPAEDYHHGYFRTNPQQAYCVAVIQPKVAKFRRKFSHRLRQH